ncbi:MAG: hypothetical protein KKH28_06935 [Elusimicrobia bacterium]|nr:hypothetical protein [Elusimicrobiota bacterium]
MAKPEGKAARPRLNIENALKNRQDLRLFNLLSAPENEFLDLLKRLESDPLFKKLSMRAPGGPPVIARVRLPGAAYAWVHNLGEPQLVNSMDSKYISGEILSARPEILALIERLGAENFEKYFLGRECIPVEQICRAAALTARQAGRIRDFVNAFLAAHENLPPEADAPRQHFKLTAFVGKTPDGGLELAYAHPAYARGLYSVDAKALKKIKRSGSLTGGELKRLGTLVKTVELVNWRKKGLQKVLEGILKFQRDFFLGGAMKPMSQRSFASELGLNPSTVSRLIARRSLKTPEEEVPLKSFFPSPKGYIIAKIKEITDSGGARKLNARLLAGELKTRYGIRISGRTVNLYRNRK